uniref:Monofunctional isopimaradiene synthase, chloroplastic n=1 Tax=Pinus contorta TaxID=3339 RepID=MISO1_PINCO|nr:RecName: Full=Monofunctional isopimaradiene synthase, chloroplastic; Short=PcmIso1; Flags: Precursor [Pinus contorta]AFU73866.1 monofunctional isopimaradiene synthase [Pinus contorta]
MAMPSYSSLSSHISITTTHTRPHPIFPCYNDTQSIPRFFISSDTGSSASKQRNIYLRLGSRKIIAGVGEGATSLSSHSDKMKTDSFPDPKLAKRDFPPGFWKDDIIDSIMSSNKVAAADEERVETLISEIKSMFRGMGDGETTPSAYDTAWVAKIPALDGSDHPHFPQTLQWILRNQLKDGSWGEEHHFLTYDRLLATLACIITLTVWRTGKTQVQKGIEFFKKHAAMMEDEADHRQPSGFEFVFPAMINEAKSLCLDLPYELPFIKQIIKKREAKLKRIPTDLLYTVPTIFLYYLEGLQEIVEWHKIIKLQSKDGSFLSSPASTAAVFMSTGNTKCLEFLNFVLMKFGNHAPCHYPIDLLERLWAVDTVQRLGIDRYFKEEIKEALDYIYSHWGERGIGWARENPVADIGVTAMGLRILRLNGYNVSSDVLRTFRDENGEFFSFMGQTERGVIDMLNLNRCSHVAFPGETVMEEAKHCTERYLWNALEDVDALDKWGLKKNIRGEVEYALKYPWLRSLPRLEARSYIENYGPNDAWLGKTMYIMPYINNGKYLELAKLDFNNVQSIHQKELRELRRWWKSSGFAELDFTRDRVAEIFFSIASSMFEPELATCRDVYTKSTICTVVLDDLYDAHGSVEDIKLFNEAVKRWDLFLLDRMPEHIKICFLGLYNLVNEIAEEGRKRQGRDVLGYIRNLWEIQLETFMKEAEWSEAKYVPSFHEYIETASVSIAGATLVLFGVLFTGEVLTDHILSQIDYRSKFAYLMGLTGRLINDTKTYQAERGEGEVASAIQCYMKDHPEFSEEEALKQIYTLMENALSDLKEEFLKAKDVPDKCKRLVFDYARSMQLFYQQGDGFTLAPNMEIKQHVKKILFEPVP